MPPTEVDLGGPMGLGHSGTEYAQVTKGMDRVAQGVAIAASLRDVVILFGMGYSCSWKKQGARRERFKDKMVDLVANPPIDDEKRED